MLRRCSTRLFLFVYLMPSTRIGVAHNLKYMELINSISCRSHQSKYMNRNSLEKGSFFVEQDINGLQLQAVFFLWNLLGKGKCKAPPLWKLTSGASRTKRKLIEEIFWWLFNYALLPWYHHMLRHLTTSSIQNPNVFIASKLSGTSWRKAKKMVEEFRSHLCFTFWLDVENL